MTYVEDPNHPNHNELLEKGVTFDSLGVHNEAKLKVVLKRPEMIELFVSTKPKKCASFWLPMDGNFGSLKGMLRTSGLNHHLPESDYLLCHKSMLLMDHLTFYEN